MNIEQRLVALTLWLSEAVRRVCVSAWTVNKAAEPMVLESEDKQTLMFHHCGFIRAKKATRGKYNATFDVPPDWHADTCGHLTWFTPLVFDSCKVSEAKHGPGYYAGKISNKVL
ncbi:hypothetical protein AMECASPLE_011684 [Ameca splendens]|uniref:Uncharacterized protein n=1 Tax=Ameca splendens TaxID=208324 RepID=A0ABV0ZL28_9TELE